MKTRDIAISAIANLMRNKTRTILTMIATFIGAFVITLVAGLNIGVNAYLDDQLNSLGGENIFIIFPAELLGTGIGGSDPTPYNPEAPIEGMDLEAVRLIYGIEDAQPVAMLRSDYIIGVHEERYAFQVSGMSDSIIIQLEAGEQLNNDTNDFEILIDPPYVEALGFSSNEDAVGSTLTLAVSNAFGERTHLEVSIAGIREPSLVNTGSSFVNYALYDEIHRINEEGLPEAMQGQIFMIATELYPNLAEYRLAEIRAELEELGYIGQTLEDQFGALSDVMNTITAVLIMFGAISLLAASFGIINTLFMSVQERTREIGLMKAVGLSSGKVFRVFSWEAILIGFFGSLFGVLGAMGIGSLINHAAEDTFLDGLPGLTLIQFTISSVLIIMLLIMFIAFLAGTLPARRASKLDPITALRSE